MIDFSGDNKLTPEYQATRDNYESSSKDAINKSDNTATDLWNTGKIEN